MLIDRLSINTPFDEPTILKLSIAYRTAITHNILGLLECRIVYYKPIPIVTKHISRIVVLTSLRHTIFNLIHVTPVTGHMGKYKTLYRTKLQLFSLEYVLTFLTGRSVVHAVYSINGGDEEGKN